MEALTPLEMTVSQTTDWVIDRVTDLSEEMDPEALEDAFSIEREFMEWLDPNAKDHDVISLEYLEEYFD